LRIGEFVGGQRQQLDPTDPARQRLSDARDQLKLSRSREDEIAHAPSLIHNPLQPGEQVGAALHLVQDGALGKASQEPTRVKLRKLAFVGVLQRHIGFVGKGGPGQGGFARLTRPGQRNNREALRQTEECMRGRARNHLRNSKNKTSICKIHHCAPNVP
jgi:hypothetical protein